MVKLITIFVATALTLATSASAQISAPPREARTKALDYPFDDPQFDDDNGGYPGDDGNDYFPGDDDNGSFPGGDDNGSFPGGDDNGSFPGGDDNGSFPGGDDNGGFPDDDDNGSFPGDDNGGFPGDDGGWPGMPDPEQPGGDNPNPPGRGGDDGGDSNPSSDQQSILEAHNNYRARHGASPLVWDETLAQFGSNWIQQCEMKHSRGKYGENLAAGYRDFKSSIAAWYDENKQYNYGSGGFSSATGHFTQVVWKGSKRIGCAKKFCSNNNWTLYICNYDPPGNVMGRFQENVSPPNGNYECVYFPNSPLKPVHTMVKVISLLVVDAIFTTSASAQVSAPARIFTAAELERHGEYSTQGVVSATEQ
ncbi:hypothetical protein FBU30_002560 [Linnemannia zychae]|nr:hypothetical protein FBU30_002560 [Linnemannia zychae]